MWTGTVYTPVAKYKYLLRVSLLHGAVSVCSAVNQSTCLDEDIPAYSPSLSRKFLGFHIKLALVFNKARW